jgi:hypothetical protein
VPAEGAGCEGRHVNTQRLPENLLTISDQEFVMSQEFVIVDFLSLTQGSLLQNFHVHS